MPDYQTDTLNRCAAKPAARSLQRDTRTLEERRALEGIASLFMLVSAPMKLSAFWTNDWKTPGRKPRGRKHKPAIKGVRLSVDHLFATEAAP